MGRSKVSPLAIGAVKIIDSYKTFGQINSADFGQKLGTGGKCNILLHSFSYLFAAPDEDDDASKIPHALRSAPPREED